MGSLGPMLMVLISTIGLLGIREEGLVRGDLKALDAVEDEEPSGQ